MNKIVVVDEYQIPDCSRVSGVDDQRVSTGLTLQILNCLLTMQEE